MRSFGGLGDARDHTNGFRDDRAAECERERQDEEDREPPSPLPRRSDRHDAPNDAEAAGASVARTMRPRAGTDDDCVRGEPARSDRGKVMFLRGRRGRTLRSGRNEHGCHDGKTDVDPKRIVDLGERGQRRRPG